MCVCVKQPLVIVNKLWVSIISFDFKLIFCCLLDLLYHCINSDRIMCYMVDRGYRNESQHFIDTFDKVSVLQGSGYGSWVPHNGMRMQITSRLGWGRLAVFATP